MGVEPDILATQRDEPETPSVGFVRRFVRHRVGLVAVVLFIIIVGLVVVGPFIVRYNPNQPDLNALLSPPSLAHPMGTDQIGNDLLSEVLYGGRISLLVGVLSAAVAVTVGGLVGSVSGYFRGAVDALLMRLTDVALSVPSLFLVLVLAAVVGPSPATIIGVIGFTSWMYPARIVRSQFLTLRTLDYVTAAQAVGVPDRRIIFRHILPNAVSPLIVNATLMVGQAIIIESTMSFLGAGVQPPTISWGYLLNQAQPYLGSAPWLAIFPGVMIFLVVLSVNLFGDALRDAMDPATANKL